MENLRINAVKLYNILNQMDFKLLIFFLCDSSLEKIKEEDMMKSIEYLLKAYGMAKESKW